MGDRHERGEAGRTQRHAGHRSTQTRCPAGRGNCENRQGSRHAQHYFQLRRIRAPRHHPAVRRQGLGFFLQPERAQSLCRDPHFPARHARGGRRLDHQRRIGSRLDQGHRQPLRLRRFQGGGHRPDQVRRDRLCQAGHPLQRAMPRHRGYAFARRAHQRLRRSGTGAQGFHCATADGPSGEGRGTGRDFGLPRIRRIRLHDRPSRDH